MVNRREYLDLKIKENKEKFFSTVQIGDVVEGVVKSFTSLVRSSTSVASMDCSTSTT